MPSWKKSHFKSVIKNFNLLYQSNLWVDLRNTTDVFPSLWLSAITSLLRPARSPFPITFCIVLTVNLSFPGCFPPYGFICQTAWVYTLLLHCNLTSSMCILSQHSGFYVVVNSIRPPEFPSDLSESFSMFCLHRASLCMLSLRCLYFFFSVCLHLSVVFGAVSDLPVVFQTRFCQNQIKYLFPVALSLLLTSTGSSLNCMFPGLGKISLIYFVVHI